MTPIAPKPAIDIVVTVVANVTPGTDDTAASISAALVQAIQGLGEPGWGYGPVAYTLNNFTVTGDPLPAPGSPF